jgi:uncharacterized protein YkwD
MSAAVKMLFGCAAFVTFSMTGQAQTYYYYPTSAPAAPSANPVATLAPTTYTQGTVGNQPVFYTYAPQVYQAAYTTQNQQITYAAQYSQPTYQAQFSQSSYDSQVNPAQYATSNGAPAVAGGESGDPYGFLGWLNSTRASYGLPAVGYDANLSNWAAMNNNQQAARGMGHFVMGPARRQNAAMGAFANIGSMWMNSPAHRAALLDPSIRAIGIAGLGAYWTFNAY